MNTLLVLYLLISVINYSFIFIINKLLLLLVG